MSDEVPDFGEPWKVSEYGDVVSRSFHLIYAGYSTNSTRSAGRVVACVNFLAGCVVPDPPSAATVVQQMALALLRSQDDYTIASVTDDLSDFVRRPANYLSRQQRQELLASCRDQLQAHDLHGGHYTPRDLLDRLDAVLGKPKEEKFDGLAREGGKGT